MSVIRKHHISRAEIRLAPNVLFMFGDNMQRRGLGGQAAEMRGELNAVGVPTKWSPGITEADYFTDMDLGNDQVRSRIDAAFGRVEHWLRIGNDVVIPTDGIGTGRAQLERRAPVLLRYINDKIAELIELYSTA